METFPAGLVKPEMSSGENGENSHSKTNYKEMLNIVIAFILPSSSKTLGVCRQKKYIKNGVNITVLIW